MSSTVSFMRQAMSTPTAYGITASRREHAADRQAVADVRVRHQRAGRGDRQRAGVLHLRERRRVVVRAPHATGHGASGRGARRAGGGSGGLGWIAPSQEGHKSRQAVEEAFEAAGVRGPAAA